ncbi:MAG: hypothetical protein CL693_02445 [Cellvibrionaceae bacterium]|nr:hypothetical protein [Cellvibrionaceae bacterium]|tara:strand:- start:27920 stop:29809 length:1890 start_codon:yes stop_codon:yes gene_type:complete
MESSAREASIQNQPFVDSNDSSRLGGGAGSTAELQSLRQLLLGADYQELLALKQRCENPNQYSVAIAQVVSEAIAIRAQKDDSIAEALGPTIEGAIDLSIKSNPKALADSLYPVMGPAIRKSIVETISGMLDGFNQAVEQSISPRAIGWRFDAWRSGKTYAEIVFLKTLVYRVEQVFLIHRETGLVLQHLESNDVISNDPDMVSAMLTAIQDFIADSFHTSADDKLSTLQLGDLCVLIEQGPAAVIASVVRGNVRADYRLRLSEVLEHCHQQYGTEFQQYQGDSSVFVKLPDLLRPCLVSVKHEERDDPNQRRKLPWISIVSIVLVVLCLGYWWYQDLQQKNHWQQWVSQLNSIPGVMVVQVEQTASGTLIKGMKDPLAQLPEPFVAVAGAGYEWTHFYATDEALQLQRIKALLPAEEGVALTFGDDSDSNSDGVLSVSGEASVEWLRQFEQAPIAAFGVRTVDFTNLKVQESNQSLVDRYLSDVSAVSIDFEVGDASIKDTQEPKLFYMATRIQQLQQILNSDRQVFKLRITGTTDGRGSDTENRRLGLARADNAARYLIEQGVVLNDFDTHFLLSEQESEAPQIRRIIVEAWVENKQLDGIRARLSESRVLSRNVDGLPTSEQESQL